MVLQLRIPSTTIVMRENKQGIRDKTPLARRRRRKTKKLIAKVYSDVSANYSPLAPNGATYNARVSASTHIIQGEPGQLQVPYG